MMHRKDSQIRIFSCEILADTKSRSDSLVCGDKVCRRGKRVKLHTPSFIFSNNNW